MVQIGGSASGDLDATFPISLDLEEADDSIDAVVQKSEKALDAQEKKWIFSKHSLEDQMDRARNRAEISFRYVLRSVYSEINQTWGIMSQFLGLGKNITYQVITACISGITSMIATAYSAAAIWAGVPVIGPFLASMMIGNAIGATTLQISTMAQQAYIQQNLDNVGNQMAGFYT
jgi:hypothetical protein